LEIDGKVGDECDMLNTFKDRNIIQMMLPQPNQQHKTKQFGWSGIIISKTNHCHHDAFTF
jgi:hypothetical protein